MSVEHPANDALRIAALIPYYNHPLRIGDVVAGALAEQLPVLIVNDGSDAESSAVLAELVKQPSVTVLNRAENGGKGAAMLDGLNALANDGYSHALQIDADGQHNVADIGRCLQLVRSHPGAIVSAAAEYDESISKARFYGHYLTHVWVWINTLSLQIRDSQTGFRAYPLALTQPIIQHAYIGKRMDFDSEILVRHQWEGVPIVHFSTFVNYPENGVSHFNMVADNVRITAMHTRLFFGMLLRFPKLFARMLQRNFGSGQNSSGQKK